MEEWFCYFVILFHELFGICSEYALVHSPECAISFSFDRSWTWGSIKQGELTEAFPFFHIFDMFAIDLDGNYTTFDNKKQASRIGLFKNILSFFTCICNNLANHLTPLVFWKIRKKEVSCNNIHNFILIFYWYLFPHRFYILWNTHVGRTSSNDLPSFFFILS